MIHPGSRPFYAQHYDDSHSHSHSAGPSGTATTGAAAASASRDGYGAYAAAQLPVAPGEVYGLTGGECAIGTVSPFTWNASPAVAPGDFLWWVIVAEDGATTEGSWGKDSAGAERDGSGLNGSSGQCSNTDKDLTNTCGQ